MNKKRNVIFVLLCSVMFSCAYSVKMPDVQTLRSNLQEAGLNGFDATTNIAQRLAGKELPVEDVINTISRGLDEYAVEGIASLRENGADHVALSQHYAQVHAYAPKIAMALFKKNQGAIKELEKSGLIAKSKL